MEKNMWGAEQGKKKKKNMQYTSVASGKQRQKHNQVHRFSPSDTVSNHLDLDMNGIHWVLDLYHHPTGT
jgi:hypothetical protein